MFIGGTTPEGFSWCSDCVDVKPFLNKTVEDNQSANPDCTVLIGVVDHRNDWVGVSDHLYRTHPLFKVGGVPTMLLFEGTNELMRVDDQAQFGDEELMKMFVEL